LSQELKKVSSDSDISVPKLGACARLADTDGKRGTQDEPRAVWLAVLQGLTIISAGIRRHLKLTIRCEHCGK
jgi:hypothetical protein